MVCKKENSKYALCSLVSQVAFVRDMYVYASRYQIDCILIEYKRMRIQFE